jgi:hypothetical protein
VLAPRLINGWPIARQVFRGNLHDDQTLTDVLKHGLVGAGNRGRGV